MKKIIFSLIFIGIMNPLFGIEEIRDSSGSFTLSGCVKIAETTYKPLKLAKQEIDVSGWKLAESTRNLFPNLTAKAEETNGDAIREIGTPAFREQTLGVQLAYPLFQSGKIWATRMQAKSNYVISVLKYDKTRQEMVYCVSEAYWNLVKARKDLSEYENAFDKLTKTYKMSQELFKSGMINEKELLSVESQNNQALYQMETAKYDLENYKWKLADALGLDKPLEGEPGDEIPFRRLDINVEECQRIASSCQTEILMQKEMVTSAKYGMKVKKSYKWPKLDLTGFYGRSGGAYEGEELKLKEDYQVGVQLSETFWLNTLSGSGMTQKTSPKLGQSSRTESNTVSTSLSFLDAYKQKAEEKEAALEHNQSLHGLDKAKLSVNSEVREAYFNYCKALVQIGNSELDATIASKELAIDKINLGNDKASVIDVAEAINKCASSNAALNDAKVFYLISLAALNKAVGIENMYSINTEQ
ncbi:MAG: TolC family protein [Elusimicrobiota bacterium]